jgi:hypothetical protein
LLFGARLRRGRHSIGVVSSSLRALLTATAAIGVAVVSVASGCTTDYRAVEGETGDAQTEATAPVDASLSDGGADANACGASLQTDGKNCGRCGHDCLGGACSAGKCQALSLGSAPSGAPLMFVAVSNAHVFVSTQVVNATEIGGIWRVPKGGGTAEPYVSLRYVNDMALLGDTLYFVVIDLPANGAGQTGGLYSCPSTGAAPCAPTLVAAATYPPAIAIDKGRILYGDDAPGRGLMAYTPPAAPTLFVADYGFPTNLFVDGQDIFYSAGIIAPQAAKLFERAPDASAAVQLAAYSGPTTLTGRLAGDATSVFFTAYDVKAPGGGMVRRVPRLGGAGCDFAGSSNARPFGLHADASRVYWTNQGKGASAPYVDGSVVSCDRSGCCSTPDVMWTGNGTPTGLAGDADALYFVSSRTGTIWKLAKP